jgi:Ca2+-transporting ATPase
MLLYLLATNAGEAITMIGALVLGVGLPITPVQILWTNLVTDSFMVIPLGLESAEDNLMRRKPEKVNAPILSGTRIWRIVVVALTMAALTLTVYVYYGDKLGWAEGGSLAFMTLVVAQWANAFNARSSYQSLFKRLKAPNKGFYWCLLGAICMQMLVFFGPLREIMRVAVVPIRDVLIVSAAAFILPIFTVELHKWWMNRRFKAKEA